MNEWYPILIIAGFLGLLTTVFLIAYMKIRSDKKAIGFDRNLKDSEITRRLLAYAKPHTRSFILIFVIILFSVSYNIAAPRLIGMVEEMVKNDFLLSDLMITVAIYAGFLVITLVCTYLQSILLQKTGQRILSKIREDLFDHIESLSHAQLNSMPVGKLVTRVTNDTNAISMLFTNILVNLLKNIFVIVGVLAAMLAVNFELTLMVLCFVPFIVLFTVIFRKFSRRAYRRVKDGTTDINTFLSEHLSGMKVIQIFNREKAKKAEFDEKNKVLGRAKRGQIFVFGIFRPTVYMLYISSVLCLLYLGGKGYIQNSSFLGQTITSGTVVTFYMYIARFFDPIQSLAEQFNWLQSAYASAEKIFTIFDLVPEITDAPDAIELEHTEGNIEFQHVWFAYTPGEWVLRDVSFTINAGDTVAFVGATGSGKTTILSLLCRNYEIGQGEILLDGIDIRHIKIASLRRQFGQMLQDVFLFSGTIRSNLLMRRTDIEDAKIMEACHYVNADGIISRLHNGLDEEVRERGNNFSAGQRQLLSFARTILQQPSVMILDEATANIDSETEQLIQNSLEKMMNNGTMLIVAHRLSTVQHADRIIVLSHGEIAEQGSHAELLAQHGRYYRLYRMQYKDRA